MTAINSGALEGYGSAGAVFMYAAATGGGGGGGPGGGGGVGDGSVTLQLREADELDDKVASVLARLHAEDATLSISYQDADMLAEGTIDVLLGTGTMHAAGNGGSAATFDLFGDSESGQDLTLSPQTFTSSTEAFINDNSDSLGVPADVDPVGSSEDLKTTADSSKLAVKKPRPKASSPNRQGPQQCQVCGKVFGNASALAKHKLTHSDERKYVCSMCGKAFKRQDHLNGHMLTHRNKKPYECKADGCGKSYCDARSLRRHTENHHTSAAASASGTAASSAGSASSGSSPPSCIQYAPPPTTPTTPTTPTSKPPSQLQKLLASETPATATSGGGASGKNAVNKDGLTKQQLELIHQIMQQTQQAQQAQQAQQTQVKPNCTPTQKAAPAKPRTTWNAQQSVSGVKLAPTTPTPAAAGTATSPVLDPAAPGVKLTADPKPVECNLCHRKFKNIPALNGHMRLHGGYFKKDSESKKCEKKETSGPPLQTASMSVRALIEEKIIQKRITNPLLANPSPTTQGTTQLTYSNGQPLGVRGRVALTLDPSWCADTQPSAATSTATGVRAPFAMPAVPAANDGKLRRHSDSEHLASLLEPAQLAQLLARKAVRRASSDPGHCSPQPQPQLQLAFQTSSGDSFSYCGDDSFFGSSSAASGGGSGSGVGDEGGLSGADQLLLDSMQLQASLMHAQSELAALDDYNVAATAAGGDNSPDSFHQGVHHQDFLPVSLADFGSYATSQPQLSSPGGGVGSSIKDTTGVESPHESPGYSYPTPPASQEGQSPSFGGNQASFASSPLSAAFYTSTMSSSAAVEAALSEVLPSLRHHAYHPSPPPPPPSSPPPVPTSTASGGFPMAPHLQSHMMSNSDDPLLSSSPKDFASRKKFEFGFKLAGGGLGDLAGAGLVLDSRGEIKLAPSPRASPGSGGFLKKDDKGIASTQRLHRVKEDPDGDVFLSPTSLEISRPSGGMLGGVPGGGARKRPRLEPLQLPARQQHTSRLRNPRAAAGQALPYTPAPMLPPARAAAGLYCNANVWPSSTTILQNGHRGAWPGAEEGSVGEPSDSTPHVNVGVRYQCASVPRCATDRAAVLREPTQDHLLWDPGIEREAFIAENEVDMYLEFACCAAVPGGGRNKEYALHVLHMCNGDIHAAMLRLMQPMPTLPAGHPLLAHVYSEADRWTPNEMDAFHHGLLKHGKDFHSIAAEIVGKSVKQCVQFYYLWKKVCPEEHRRWRQLHRRGPDRKLLVPVGGVEVELVSTTSSAENRLFVCEVPDCSASFNSRAALNGHIRIHGGGCARSPPPDRLSGDPLDQFPCKICGKVFNKVKSRSAHMKSHRPPDAEPKRTRPAEPNKPDAPPLPPPPLSPSPASL